MKAKNGLFMKIRYRKIRPSDRKIVAKLVKDFYKELPGIRGIDDKKIKRTFLAFAANPNKGNILVIEKEKIIIGYALLANFWSNEWGGNVLFLDEIYIKPEFRGQGIGRDFINYLIKKKYNRATAIQLEVAPTNKRARALYKDIGFKPYQNEYLLYNL